MSLDYRENKIQCYRHVGWYLHLRDCHYTRRTDRHTDRRLGKHNTPPLTLTCGGYEYCISELHFSWVTKTCALFPYLSFITKKFHKAKVESVRVVFPFCCNSNQNFSLTKIKKCNIFLWSCFISLSWTLSRLQDRVFLERQTASPLSPRNHITIICAALTVFVATCVC